MLILFSGYTKQHKVFVPSIHDYGWIQGEEK